VTRWIGHPAPLDHVVARTPTLTVGLGCVVVDPGGVGFELVAVERRLPGDRPRNDAASELFVQRRRVRPRFGGRSGFAAGDPDVRGGGGSSRNGCYRSAWYVHGLPARGDLKLIVTAHSHGVHANVVLDGDALRRAAACATPLWPDGGEAAIRSGR
jgi:hypothetical protein